MSVVVVNYNGGAFIAGCLEGLREQTVAPLEVIVVDNASTDDSPRMLQERFPEARLILNRENRGFTGGCNDGVATARGSWIAFLAPDARPEPSWLEELIRASRECRRGDLIRSLVLDDGVPPERYRLVETMNIVGRLVRVEGVEGDFAFSAAGAAMLFEKEQYPVPLPEGYFLYHEDLYFSWLARVLGHEVRLARDSRTAHIGQASTSRVRNLSDFHGEKNRITNFLLFWQPETIARLLPVMAFDVLLHIPQNPGSRLKAIIWVFGHRRDLRERRRRIQRARVVPDDRLLSLLSARVSPRSGRLNDLYNRLAIAYCRAMGFRVLELSRVR